MKQRISASEIGNNILDALQVWDRAAAPVGLYAAREFRRPSAPEEPFRVEWELVVAPVLKAAGCNPMAVTPGQRKRGCFHLQSGGKVEVCHLARLSLIKVRKYGNRHRTDPHVDHDPRWREFDLRSRIRLVSRIPRGLLIFIGFTNDGRPFAREIRELGRTLQPVAQRAWSDPHGRGFNTFTALWAHE